MYKIIYELKTKDSLNTHEFTVDEVDINDRKAQEDLARNDSSKYNRSGVFSVHVVSAKFIE